MTPLVTVDTRSDGTFSAAIEFNLQGVSETCTHKHGDAKAAEACGNWEANAIRKGQTRWHAPKAQRGTLNFDKIAVAVAAVDDQVTDDEVAHSHEYVPMPELASLWHAVVTGAKSRPAANLLFVGPSGSGKTDGARYLAALVGLPFTKVDAASMTDPEAWFGTREIVVQDGVAVTDYIPSAFVQAIQKPGLVLIDEVTRVRDEHRNVLLPLLDGTRAVMNPLTGEVLHRHPQCFIVMAGNVGLHFTGTNAIDPAFLTRALTVEFDYISDDIERKVVVDASGCDEEAAYVFVKFANETRAKAKVDDQFVPISTREIIEAGRLVKDGLTRDLAVKFTVLNAASGEGGSSSIRQELQNIWNGVRAAKLPTTMGAQVNQVTANPAWVCPTHSTAKDIPAGISMKTGKAYQAFRACTQYGCPHTSDKSPSRYAAPATQTGKTCGTCGNVNPVGRNAICVNCGAAI